MRRSAGFPILALALCLALTACEAPIVPWDSYEPGTLPDRLSDAEFWEMVTTFSEPDGTFPYENFVSNEIDYQSIVPDLLERVPSEGVYLGVAIEQNFTYIAALDARLAFIVDIRRQNMLEHLLYKALFEMSPTRQQFVSRLFSRRPAFPAGTDASVEDLFSAFDETVPDGAFYEETRIAVFENLTTVRGFDLSEDDLENMALILRVFRDAGPGLDYTFRSATPGSNMPSYARLMAVSDRSGTQWSFLAEEARYQRVRTLQERNGIIPVVGDFAGPKALRSIAEYLARHGATVTVFYISNVEDYLDRTWAGWYTNLQRLPIEPYSQFIRFVPQRQRLRPMTDVSERWPGRNW